MFVKHFCIKGFPRQKNKSKPWHVCLNIQFFFTKRLPPGAVITASQNCRLLVLTKLGCSLSIYTDCSKVASVQLPSLDANLF